MPTKKEESPLKIAPPKTDKEILNALGLPHSPVYLKIAQAALQPELDLRAQLIPRLQAIHAHLQRVTDLFAKLHPDGLIAFVKEHRRLKQETKALKEQLTAAERALVDVNLTLTKEQRAEIADEHRLPIRRAKDHQCMMSFQSEGAWPPAKKNEPSF